jgi:hypothetical protein
LVVGIIAILVGVFAVATGRGGELAYEHADHAPLDLGPVTATDVALLRPPTALWGYNMQVTDEALDRIARALRDRDIEIAYLQRQLADLGQASRTGQASEASGAGEGVKNGPAQDERAGSLETANEEGAPTPRRFVPKHERPRVEAVGTPAATEPVPVDEPTTVPSQAQASETKRASAAEQASKTEQASVTKRTQPKASVTEESQTEPDDDDAVAAAEEQGW